MVLEKVTVEGAGYFSHEGYLGRMTLIEGIDEVDVSEIEGKLISRAMEKEVARLRQTGYLKSVAYILTLEEGGLEARLLVEENPRFLMFRVTGATLFANEAIRDVLEAQFVDRDMATGLQLGRPALRVGAPINTQQLEAVAEGIAQFYREKGYLAGAESWVVHEDGAVEFKVGEGRVESVKVEGNAIVDRRDILLNIMLKPGDLIELAILESDKARLMATGVFRAVELEVRPSGKGPFLFDLVVKVKEKWEKVLAGFDIEGLVHVPKEDVMSVIALQVGQDLKPELIQDAVKSVQASGLFQVVKPELEPLHQGTKITLHVVENPVLTELRLKGNTVLSEEEIKEGLLTRPGTVLNLWLLRQDIERIEKVYESKGYAVMRVLDNTLDLQGEREAALELFIGEGRIEEIRVEGEREEEVVKEDGTLERRLVPANLRTKSFVITREMTSKAGDILNVNVLKRDLQKIWNLGYFDDVHWEPEPGTEEDSITVVIKIREKESLGTAMFGAGYSSQFGLTGNASITRDNLFGKGRLASATVSFGGLSAYELRYKEPWLDRHHTSMDVSAFNTVTPRDFSVVEGGVVRFVSYDETRQGGVLLFGRPILRDTRANIGVELKSQKFKLVSGTAAPDIADGSVRSLRMGITKDSRDNIFDATGGIYNDFTVKVAGFGGDFDFRRYQLDLRRYKRVGGRFTLAARGILGLFEGRRSLGDLFFAGGAETLRGYQESFFNGETLLLLNTEVRFQISAQGITGVLFTDMGDAWSDHERDFDLKVGTGFGLRYALPGLGPIRIDYGYGWKDRDSQIYLSFGQMF